MIRHKSSNSIFACNCYYTPTGAAIIALYYDALLPRFQSLGVHVAVSSISRGKTNCAKVALAIVGNSPKGYTIYLTDSMARSYLGGALPFVYDDPSSDRVLKPQFVWWGRNGNPKAAVCCKMFPNHYGQ